MPTGYMIIANPSEGATIAESGVDRHNYSFITIDPVGYVELAKLFSFITGDDYEIVDRALQSRYLTPAQPGVEPWEIDRLFAAVFTVPEKYLHTLANLDDNQVESFAARWGLIEELTRLNWPPNYFRDLLELYSGFAQDTLAVGKTILLYFTP